LLKTRSKRQIQNSIVRLTQNHLYQKSSIMF